MGTTRRFTRRGVWLAAFSLAALYAAVMPSRCRAQEALGEALENVPAEPVAIPGMSQVIEPAVSEPPAQSPAADSQTAQTPVFPSFAPPSSPGVREVSWGKFAGNTLRDQQRIWSFPYFAARGHHLAPTLIAVGATAGLIALDRTTASPFRGTHAFRGFDRVFSGQNTWLATESAPAAVYFAGLAFRNSKAQQTGLLAAEAFLDSEIVVLVMEDASHRLLPDQMQNPSNPSWFRERHCSYLSGCGGFPSGHTIAAFSIATVIARRYSNHRWVPWVAYGLASLDGFSRLTLRSHFPSDVLVGGALGYAIARYVVLPPQN